MFVPIRFISEALDKIVIWDKDTRILDILDTKYNIENYLMQNYSTLNTSIGKTNFTFFVFEKDKNNDSLYLHREDYIIIVNYDFLFSSKLTNTIDIDNNTRQKVLNELQEHMQKIANSLIILMPDKKMDGYYFGELSFIHNYHWKNYNNNIITDFQWCPEYDSGHFESYN